MMNYLAVVRSKNDCVFGQVTFQVFDFYKKTYRISGYYIIIMDRLWKVGAKLLGGFQMARRGFLVKWDVIG